MAAVRWCRDERSAITLTGKNEKRLRKLRMWQGLGSERKRGARAETFLALPQAVVDSSQFIAMSAPAVKLLIDLFAQFRGANNGDLCATWSLMKPRGWRSKGTLHAALQELLNAGFLLCTRQGGRNRASLYALTFMAIDECGGKLDVAATRVSPGTWKNGKRTRYVGQVASDSGPMKEVA